MNRTLSFSLLLMTLLAGGLHCTGTSMPDQTATAAADTGTRVHAPAGNTFFVTAAHAGTPTVVYNKTSYD